MSNTDNSRRTFLAMSTAAPAPWPLGRSGDSEWINGQIVYANGGFL